MTTGHYSPDDVLKLYDEIGSRIVAENGSSAILVAGIMNCTALFAIADAIHRLGNADATTPMGGMEALGKIRSESLDRIADRMEKS